MLELDRINNILYVSDQLNGCIRQLNINTSQVTTLATNINAPGGLAYDFVSQSLFVVSTATNVIYSIPISTGHSAPIAVNSDYILTGSSGM